MKNANPYFLILLLLTFFCPKNIFSQKIDSVIYDRFSKAEDYLYKKSYDTSLMYSLQAIAISEKNNRLQNLFYCKAFYIAANCFEKKKDVIAANDYYTKGLQNATVYNHTMEQQEAFIALNTLHGIILKNNLSFPYTPPITTIEEEVYFSIEKTKQAGDSIDITIYGGFMDGIAEVGQSILIYPRHDTALKSTDYLGKARIINVDNNRTLARMPTGTWVKPNDLAIIKAQVPVTILKSALKKYALYGIGVTDNIRQPIFNYRYLRYFFNDKTDSIAMAILKSTVDEVVKYYGEDTLTNAQLGAKIKEGIFAGKNVMLGMHQSTPDDLVYFLNFISEFPGKYIGNTFKFSEIFATWMINNSPMAKNDITGFLTKIKNANERKFQSYNLRNAIKEENLSADWLNKGLLAASFDDLKVTTQNAILLNGYGSATNDLSQLGWASYLRAISFQKNDDRHAADSTLKTAKGFFEKAKDKEGILWTNNSLSSQQQNETVSFSVQSGHLLNFFLAMSPNPRYFASGSQDNLVKIWDALSGKEIKTIAAHTDEILSINYSLDGRYLITCSMDSTIKIWNAYDYSLINTLYTRKPETTVLFTPDSKYILSAGRDSLIKLMDPLTGKIIKTFSKHKARVTGLAFDPFDPSIFVSSSADSMLYKWHLDSTNTIGRYKEKARVLDVKISNNGLYMSTLTADSMLNIWYYDKSKRYFSDTINVKNMGNYKHFASGDFSPDGKFLAYPSNKKTINIYELASGNGQKYPTESYSFLSDIMFTADGNSFIQKFNLGDGMRITNFKDWSPETAPGRLITKELKQYANPPASIQFTNDNIGLYILSNNTSLYNFAEGTTAIVNQIPQAVNHQFLVLKNKNYSISTFPRQPMVQVYDNIEKRIVDTIQFPTAEVLSAITISKNDSSIYIGGDSVTLVASSIFGHKMQFVKSFKRDADSRINRLILDSIQNRLYVSVDYDKVFVLNAGTGELIDSISAPELFDVAPMPGAVYISGADDWLYKYSTQNYKLIKKIKVSNLGISVNMLKMSHDFTKLAIINSSKSVMVLDTKTDKPLYVLNDHDYLCLSIDISPDDHMLATSGIDNKVNLYDLSSGKKIITLHTPYEEDFVASDPEGHYMAPKKSLDGVVFNYKNNAFNFEQFDLQFNRPDIILSKLGKANPSLVESYRAAYLRRLKKLGLTEDQIKLDLHLPLVRILDKLQVRPTTNADHYEIKVECYDSKYSVQTLHVFVNNTPLFGSTGKDMLNNTTGSGIEKVNIPLSLGNNIIKIFCTNNKGATSLQETFEVFSNYKTENKPKVYFVGIAVARYKDSTMNLTYSAKDVRDLATGFKSLYPQMELDTLIDSKATKENILAIKKKLESTSVNDKVIVAVTGHGLLSDSLDFYYGTYDIDFKNPRDKGLRYEDLENILNEIPARQKLLLIDACHSGALDKEFLIAQKALQLNNEPGAVKEIGNRSSIKVNKAKVSLNNTFDLMQNLFADLSTSNGTVVISAAGGLEYAFESPEWNNGVFTYCVRKGIEEKEADTDGGNSDGVVTVQELQQYVSRKVSELTKGRQKPTSRKENLDNDWRIR